MRRIIYFLCVAAVIPTTYVRATEQPPNTWVKRSPLPDAPVSPRMGYEASWGYDPRAKLLIRWAGHNQGGGGEQNAETWTLDPRSMQWALKLTNTSPPGVCCAQQNVFDPAWNRFLRFPSFSGSHGWQWWREIYLNNSSVWSYDLASNTWRDLRPLPEPRVSPLRCASWDSDHDVVVVFGGEGNHEGTLVCDPYTNTWTHRRPPEQPEFRSGGNMTYDAARQRHILFGSQFSDDPHTWAYDLRANRWHDLQPTVQPHTDRNDAVLGYDSLNQVVIAVVKITEGKDDDAKHRLETWSFDAGRNTWTKMNPPQEPDPSGNRARLLTFLPDLGLTVVENRTHPPHGPAEQQIWTYRFPAPNAESAPPPTAPFGLRLTTRDGGASLKWTVSESQDVAGYVISRGEGPTPWEASWREIRRVHAGQTTFDDSGLARGTTYYYAVRAVDSTGRASFGSANARTQPRVIDSAVVSVLSDRQVELSWTSPDREDTVGYSVERAAVEVWTDDQMHRVKNRTPPLADPMVAAVRRIGPFDKVTGSLLTEPHFTDHVDLAQPQTVEGDLLLDRPLNAEQVDSGGRPYCWAVFAYRVRSVNRLGVESGPSPYFLTIPSAPQWLYSREQATQCDLKWSANAEKKLRGYRVYRMEGRYDKQPVTRLTESPLADTTFSDPDAGKDTRRYHVVAVDALGQEGFPSSPVWFQREWQAFYKPFVGEWHQ